jgi:hypothetical protein
MKFYNLSDRVPNVKTSEQRNFKAIDAGYSASPKKGEWFLSGAIPEAYRAQNDLTGSFYRIVKIVRVKQKKCYEILEHL